MTGFQADGELVIEGGGQKLGGWTRISVSRSIEGCPSRFSIGGTARFPSELRSLIALNVPIKITIGGKVVLTGYLERVTSRISPEEHGLSWSGRGRLADLVDSAALISNQTRLLSSVGTLARELAKPFDGPIQVLTPTGDGDGKTFSFSIDLGETVYEIIERYTRYEGLLVYENEDGNLVLSRVGTVKHSSGLTEGQNVQEIEFTNSADQRFSVYIPLLMSGDTLTRDGTVAGGGNAAGDRVTDPGITRYRPRIIISEQTTNDGLLAHQRALWESARRRGRSFRVVATVDSWLDSAGTPWTPNQIVPIDFPSLGLKQPDWILVDVTYRRDDKSGTTAILTLMPPEALTVQPTALNAMDARAATPDSGSSPTGPAATASPPTTAPNAGDGRRDRNQDPTGFASSAGSGVRDKG